MLTNYSGRLAAWILESTSLSNRPRNHWRMAHRATEHRLRRLLTQLPARNRGHRGAAEGHYSRVREESHSAAHGGSIGAHTTAPRLRWPIVRAAGIASITKRPPRLGRVDDSRTKTIAAASPRRPLHDRFAFVQIVGRERGRQRPTARIVLVRAIRAAAVANAAKRATVTCRATVAIRHRSHHCCREREVRSEWAVPATRPQVGSGAP